LPVGYGQSLKVDPAFTRSKVAVAINHLKIGSILMDTDPADAIEAYHRTLAILEALPEADRATVRRIMASTDRKLAMAFTEARSYGPSLAAFKRARGPFERLAAADAEDTRAAHDLAAVYSNEALTWIDLGDPLLNPRPDNRNQDLDQALRLLARSIGIMQHLVDLSPANQGLALPLAYDQVLAGTLKQQRRPPAPGEDLAAQGLAALRQAAMAPDATPQTLDLASSALLKALPLRLRDPALAQAFAERMVAQTHRRKAVFLLSLAQALHATGQRERARATAREGLALLPPPRPGTPRTRTRILLEAELEEAPPQPGRLTSARASRPGSG
jgi:eukaryotic-like serine/threonine-protein kinase